MQSTSAAALPLYFCSRMAPFDDGDFRQRVHELYGEQGRDRRKAALHVELQPGAGEKDVRAPCIRSLRGCSGVVLLLDGTTHVHGLRPGDAPVLELEVMFAALSGLPTVVVDASDGQDRLFRLLGSEFFRWQPGRGTQLISVPTHGSIDDIVNRATQAVGCACEKDFSSRGALHEATGWERLFRARPDRRGEYVDDGGNFPFSNVGLGVLQLDHADAEKRLELAASLHGVQKLDALVATWDVIRGLSYQPWAATRDVRTQLQWLRAFELWGSLTQWLGLFGHSSAATVMSALSGLHLASRANHTELMDGSGISEVVFYNRLASAYYSVSKIVQSAAASNMQQLGIRYATEGIQRTASPRSRASLLGIRASIWMAIDPQRALSDAQACIDLHLSASRGNRIDEGYAHSLIRLGVVLGRTSELQTRSTVAVKAIQQLREGCAILTELATAGSGIDQGQLVMGRKALTEVLIQTGHYEAAEEELRLALKLAKEIDALDQLRQLNDLESRLKIYYGGVRGE